MSRSKDKRITVVNKFFAGNFNRIGKAEVAEQKHFARKQRQQRQAKRPPRPRIRTWRAPTS